MKALYVTPEMEIQRLQEAVVIACSGNETDLQLGYDPDDPVLNIDSREYDPDYACSLGLPD